MRLLGGRRIWFALTITFMVLGFQSSALAGAGDITVPSFTFVEAAETPEQISTSLEVILIMTVLTVLPSIILSMTCFTRIIVVFSFLRRAMGTQELPPTQIIMGLALFLSAMVMAPVIDTAYQDGMRPYMDGEIGQDLAGPRMIQPFRDFMFKQTRARDLEVFLTLKGIEVQGLARKDVPTLVLIPSFMVSELTRAFYMGFLIYLPFLVIDMVVASILMSMGMMMLPPVMISLPFKVLLFVMVDGWALMVTELVRSFY